MPLTRHIQSMEGLLVDFLLCENRKWNKEKKKRRKASKEDSDKNKKTRTISESRMWHSNHGVPTSRKIPPPFFWSLTQGAFLFIFFGWPFVSLRRKSSNFTERADYWSRERAVWCSDYILIYVELSNEILSLASHREKEQSSLIFPVSWLMRLKLQVLTILLSIPKVCYD